MKQPSLPKIDIYSNNKNTVYLYLEERKKLKQIAKEKNVSIEIARNFLTY